MVGGLAGIPSQAGGGCPDDEGYVRTGEAAPASCQRQPGFRNADDGQEAGTVLKEDLDAWAPPRNGQPGLSQASLVWADKSARSWSGGSWRSCHQERSGGKATPSRW